MCFFRHDCAPPSSIGQQLHGGQDPAAARSGNRPAGGDQITMISLQKKKSCITTFEFSGRRLLDGPPRRLRQRGGGHRKVSFIFKSERVLCGNRGVSHITENLGETSADAGTRYPVYGNIYETYPSLCWKEATKKCT